MSGLVYGKFKAKKNPRSKKYSHANKGPAKGGDIDNSQKQSNNMPPLDGVPSVLQTCRTDELVKMLNSTGQKLLDLKALLIQVTNSSIHGLSRRIVEPEKISSLFHVHWFKDGNTIRCSKNIKWTVIMLMSTAGIDRIGNRFREDQPTYSSNPISEASGNGWLH